MQLSIHLLLVKTEVCVLSVKSTANSNEDLPEDVVEEVGENENLGNGLHVVHNVWVIFLREAGKRVETRDPYIVVKKQ
jgi:hypothetical protein